VTPAGGRKPVLAEDDSYDRCAQLDLRLQKYGIEKPSSDRKPVTRLIATEGGLDPGGFRVWEC